MKINRKYLMLLVLVVPGLIIAQEEPLIPESLEKWNGKMAEELSFLVRKLPSAYESQQEKNDPNTFLTSGLDVEMIKTKFENYHNGDWESWISKYEETAKIFYNTRDDPMTPVEAAKMHKNSVAALSYYKFDPKDILIEKINLGPGRSKVFFRGYWKAKFLDSDREFEIPTQVSYYIINGKITEEYGFWDNSVTNKAYKEMLSLKKNK